jgi:hypothetical protein
VQTQAQHWNELASITANADLQQSCLALARERTLERTSLECRASIYEGELTLVQALPLRRVSISFPSSFDFRFLC